MLQNNHEEINFHTISSIEVSISGHSSYTMSVASLKTFKWPNNFELEIIHQKMILVNLELDIRHGYHHAVLYYPGSCHVDHPCYLHDIHHYHHHHANQS